MDFYHRKLCLVISLIFALLITGCSSHVKKTAIKEIKPEGVRESSLGNIKMKYNVALYSGPEWSGELLSEIDREVKLKAICETDNWILVEAPNEMTGWVGRSWIDQEKSATNINVKHSTYILSEPACLSKDGRVTHCPDKSIDLVLFINKEDSLEVISETEDWVFVRVANPKTDEPETGWIAKTWVENKETYDCASHPSTTKTYYSEYIDSNNVTGGYSYSKNNSSGYSMLNATLVGVDTFGKFIEALDGFFQIMSLVGGAIP